MVDVDVPPVELFTIAQVAEMFTVTPDTVRVWLRAGRFPNARKVGGKNWRVPRQDIVDFVEEGKK